MDRAQLIIMRHATAGMGGGRDHERPLTGDGHDEARRVGERLRLIGPLPTHVVSSSARRCQETWAAVSAGLGAHPTLEIEDALYNAPAESLLRVIAGIPETPVLLVLAHNPGVSVLAHELAGADPATAEQLRGGFAPATTACFDVEGSWACISPRTVRLTRFEAAPSA